MAGDAAPLCWFNDVPGVHIPILPSQSSRRQDQPCSICQRYTLPINIPFPCCLQSPGVRAVSRGEGGSSTGSSAAVPPAAVPGSDWPPARQQMRDLVFRWRGRPRPCSVSSGNAAARVSPRRGLPGEHQDRGRPSSGYAHLQKALTKWKGAALEDGFQGGTGSPSKLSRQLWCRMGGSRAAQETFSLRMG